MNKKTEKLFEDWYEKEEKIYLDLILSEFPTLNQESPIVVTELSEGKSKARRAWTAGYNQGRSQRENG